MDSLLREVALRQPQMEALPVELRAAGEVVPISEKTVEVRAPGDGIIIEVYRRVGDRVRQGEPLLRIRSPQLSEWETQLEALEAQLNAQRLRVSALERMAQESLATALEVSAARAEYFSLEAQKRRLTQQLSLYRRAFNGFILLSPIAGTILSLPASAGTSVQDGELLVRLADLEKVRLQVYLYPEQYAQARVGMEGEAYIPGYSTPVPFKIERFLPGFGEETRAATGIADVANPGYTLLPGLFFHARLRLLRSDSALAIPIAAVILDADQRYAILYHPPCGWEVRPIRMIRQVGQKAYVQGIAPSETLATRQVLYLYQQLTRLL